MKLRINKDLKIGQLMPYPGSLLQKLLVMQSMFVNSSGLIKLFRAMKMIGIPKTSLLNWQLTTM
jgi:hypothetical protein